MSQHNQPPSGQPWSPPPRQGQDVSPWAEREGLPGLGGSGRTSPAAPQPPSGNAGPHDGSDGSGGPSGGSTGPHAAPPSGGARAGNAGPQSHGHGDRPSEPTGQAPPQHYGPQPYGPPPYGPAQPYGAQHYGAQQYGQTPPQQHGAQWPGQAAPPLQGVQQYGQTPQDPASYGHPQPDAGRPGAAPASGRPVWKSVVGILLAIWSGLALLSALSRAGSLIATSSGRGAAYQFGSLIGVLIMIVLPAVLAWLLLRRKR